MKILDYSGNHLYQDHLCPCPSHHYDSGPLKLEATTSIIITTIIITTIVMYVSIAILLVTMSRAKLGVSCLNSVLVSRYVVVLNLQYHINVQYIIIASVLLQQALRTGRSCRNSKRVMQFVELIDVYVQYICFITIVYVRTYNIHYKLGVQLNI